MSPVGDVGGWREGGCKGRGGVKGEGVKGGSKGGREGVKGGMEGVKGGREGAKGGREGEEKDLLLELL